MEGNFLKSGKLFGKKSRSDGILIVMLTKKIHGFAELMEVNEGTYHNEGTEEVPAPEIAGAEIVGNAPFGKGVLDPYGDVVIPDHQNDGEREQRDYVGEQVVHGPAVILPRGYLIEIEGKGNEENDTIDAEG